MKPSAVMPFHDPDGRLLGRLDGIEPRLKEIFAGVFAGVTAPTADKQPEAVRRLEADPFYQVEFVPDGLKVGEQFKRLYEFAARESEVEQPLHLCFLDRVAFILSSALGIAFAEDMEASVRSREPVLFTRSTAAWSTHPQNYLEIEHMATRAGELLFGRSLDFAWCHLALRAGRLEEVLREASRPDISMMGEMILPIVDEVEVRPVDWLAWEDPWLLDRDADALRAERESSLEETRKRLAYVIPTLELMYRYRGSG